MNICVLSGKLAKNASVRGTDPRVMSFVLEIHSASNEQEQRKPVFVPCVVFNPSKELEHQLAEGSKGTSLELEGRLSSSSFEARGETRHTCEVIVRNWTLVVQPGFTTAG